MQRQANCDPHRRQGVRKQRIHKTFAKGVQRTADKLETAHAGSHCPGGSKEPGHEHAASKPVGRSHRARYIHRSSTKHLTKPNL
eukprot:1964571-Amphidinium_carterae.1